MQLTEDVYELPCPDGTDYAALALAMQRLAERIEEIVLGQQAAMVDFEEQRTAIWRNTAVIGPISNSGFAEFTFGLAQVVFANYGAPTGPNLQSNPGQTFPEAGVYALGWSVNTAETGAANVQTARNIAATVRRHGVGVPVDVVTLSRTMSASAATAGGVGDYFGSCAVFALGNDFALHSVAFRFTHGNTSSTVQIPIGGATAWLMRLGSIDVLEVT